GFSFPPVLPLICFSLFDPPAAEIYTLSLHDALPIFMQILIIFEQQFFAEQNFGLLLPVGHEDEIHVTITKFPVKNRLLFKEAIEIAGHFITFRNQNILQLGNFCNRLKHNKDIDSIGTVKLFYARGLYMLQLYDILFTML